MAGVVVVWLGSGENDFMVNDCYLYKRTLLGYPAYVSALS
jgi:hypothetical protein